MAFIIYLVFYGNSGFTAWRKMQNDTSLAHDPTIARIHKPDGPKILFGLRLVMLPLFTAIGREKNRSFLSDHPSIFEICEEDTE